MDKSELGKFQTALATIAETMGGSLTDERVLIYFDALCDLPLREIQSACKRAIREMKFFPKPVELRELTSEANAVEQRAESAWLTLLKIMDHEPYNVTIIVRDPVLASTIRSLGGPVVIWNEPDFAKFSRKRFGETYRTHLSGEPRESRPFNLAEYPRSITRIFDCEYAGEIATIESQPESSPFIAELALQKRIN